MGGLAHALACVDVPLLTRRTNLHVVTCVDALADIAVEQPVWSGRTDLLLGANTLASLEVPLLALRAYLNVIASVHALADVGVEQPVGSGRTLWRLVAHTAADIEVPFFTLWTDLDVVTSVDASTDRIAPDEGSCALLDLRAGAGSSGWIEDLLRVAAGRNWRLNCNCITVTGLLVEDKAGWAPLRSALALTVPGVPVVASKAPCFELASAGTPWEIEPAVGILAGVDGQALTGALVPVVEGVISIAAVAPIGVLGDCKRH